MAQSKKTPADHSRDYRQREQEQEKATKLGIEKITIDMAAGVKAGMAAAMKRNGIKNAQEAWQNIGLYLMRASPEEQDRMLKSGTSDFVISLKLARQYLETASAELKANPGDEIVPPESTEDPA
ncbi:hypothetical protein SAMN05216593_1011 [Pseudomonas asturiensis]|uniref:Uncharacterized protein n=1 Tax=Pseudomonas asturiensis TaxID=1190415 RepID=A0A1M7IYB4_9PSED|nr:hypothetical protein [Pseudomonas asturiensis]SHM45688.1 hypothetical protein SAMN05216593_1011 [Pseudomonas asturiensis]